MLDEGIIFAPGPGRLVSTLAVSSGFHIPGLNGSVNLCLAGWSFRLRYLAMPRMRARPRGQLRTARNIE